MRLLSTAFLALFCTATIAAEAPPQGMKALSEKDLNLITRCSHAASLVVIAAEKIPNDKESRAQFITNVYAKIKEANQLGNLTPSYTEIFSAQLSMESLINNNMTPSTPKLRDWFMAQSAAGCALQSEA